MSKKRRKKRKAGVVFLQGFGTTLLVVALLFLTGFASYKVSLFYFNKKGAPGGNRVSAVMKELYGGAEVQDISKNLIYGVDKESGRVRGLVLEIFHTGTGNMDYITIPVNTEITVSNELYQKLIKSGCEAPQIVKLSAIHKYYSGEDMYEYGELLLNDLLGIDIGYYTVEDIDTFKKKFERIDCQTTVQGEEAARLQTVKLWVLKEGFKAELNAVEKKEKAVKEYIEASYKDCTSNLSLRSKKSYAGDYLKWNPDYTHYYVIPGVAEEKYYEPLPEEGKALLEQILGNSTYIEQQQLETAGTEADSRAYRIQILNASQINGLAAKYQRTLEAQGYTVDSVGNYTGQMQTASRILVRNEGTGADLLLYLENAQLSGSAVLPEGIDIQIILGTDADK